MNPFAPPDLPGDPVPALRAPLLAALRPPPRLRAPRLRLRAAAALALALTLAAVLALALPGSAPAPALAVERDGDWLVLRIADVAAGEDALTRELRDAGVRGEVRLLPVDAEQVGTWAVISEEAGSAGPREVVRLDRVRYEGETLRIPVAELRESTGTFVFYAGRAARPGEEPMRDGRLRFRG